jgi:hypothetical protein
MRVSEAAATAPRREPTLMILREVVQQIACGGVEDLCADGDAHNRVLAVSPRTLRALAVPPALGQVLRVITKMQQRIERLVSFYPDISAAPAISTRRPAARHKLLTAKGRHAVAAVSTLHANFGAINKQ